VQKSPEILALAEQNIRDQQERGGEAALEVTTREPGLLSIGTGPSDWFTSIPELEQALAASASSEVFPQENREIETYEEGTVGWGYIRSDLKLPNGTFKVRQTFIVHKEESGWKFIHSHVSVGLTDEQLLGIE
jgi:hypothetical protein